MQESNVLHNSLLRNQVYIRTDYIDVHSQTFISPCQILVDSAVKEFFYCIPKPFVWMIALREVVAGGLGLKTANGKNNTLMEIELFKGEVGERIALFEVWDRTEKEILTGEHDKHLDFILSFHLENIDKQHILRLFTAVQINSWLGEAYFFIVKPIHKVLMPMLVERMAGKLANGC